MENVGQRAEGSSTPAALLTGTSFRWSLSHVPIDQLAEADRACNICFTNFPTHKYFAFGTGKSEERPTRLPCQHVFGHQCLAKWLHDHNTCPLCRRVLFDKSAEAANTQDNSNSRRNNSRRNNAQRNNARNNSNSPRGGLDLWSLLTEISEDELIIANLLNLPAHTDLIRYVDNLLPTISVEYALMLQGEQIHRSEYEEGATRRLRARRNVVLALELGFFEDSEARHVLHEEIRNLNYRFSEDEYTRVSTGLENRLFDALEARRCFEGVGMMLLRHSPVLRRYGDANNRSIYQLMLEAGVQWHTRKGWWCEHPASFFPAGWGPNLNRS